jgi:E3 ubiquitin-protein ligase SHPRH
MLTLVQYDICITTYSVLVRELTVAHAVPERARRQHVEYAEGTRTRSPLVMCAWHRVVMDEVQMVGGGKAEEMVSLIPRGSSLAVSGTPARAQVKDLAHVARFLRVPGAMDANEWRRLCAPENVDLFAALFRAYGIRCVPAGSPACDTS